MDVKRLWLERGRPLHQQISHITKISPVDGVTAICRVAVFRDFGDTQGKSHGLPKKVLKFSVNTAYCQNLQVFLVP